MNTKVHVDDALTRCLQQSRCVFGVTLFPRVFEKYLPAAHTDIEGFQDISGLTSLHIPRLTTIDSISTSTVSLDLPSPHGHRMLYVLVYSAINLVQLTGALRASRRLLKELLHNVVYAAVRFHDTTPAGKRAP